MAFGGVVSVWMDNYVPDCAKYNSSDDEVFRDVSRVRTGMSFDTKTAASKLALKTRWKVPSRNKCCLHNTLQSWKFHQNVRLRAFQLFPRSVERFWLYNRGRIYRRCPDYPSGGKLWLMIAYNWCQSKGLFCIKMIMTALVWTCCIQNFTL